MYRQVATIKNFAPKFRLRLPAGKISRKVYSTLSLILNRYAPFYIDTDGWNSVKEHPFSWWKSATYHYSPKGQGCSFSHWHLNKVVEGKGKLTTALQVTMNSNEGKKSDRPENRSCNIIMGTFQFEVDIFKLNFEKKPSWNCIGIGSRWPSQVDNLKFQMAHWVIDRVRRWVVSESRLRATWNVTC